MTSDTGGASLIFSCRMCGDCCVGYGGTYVTAEDIAAIADYIGKDPAEVVRDYCMSSGSRLVLGQGKEGYCLFWDGICTIHPVKPRMCDAWPFIGSVLVDVSNWHAMASGCPGMRTDVSDELIVKTVREMIQDKKDPPRH